MKGKATNKGKRAESGFKLTPGRREYCRLRVQGVKQSEAYRLAYNAPLSKDKAARAHGARLEAMPCIQAEIERLQVLADKEAVATREEILKFWTRVLRTPIGEIDEGSVLCQEVTHGKFGTTTKSVSKSDAAKELSRLLGAYEPEKVEVGGVGDFKAILDAIPDQPLVTREI